MTQIPKQLSAVPDLPPFYKPSSQLEMVELRYSAIPGQPSIIYWDSSNDTVVSICPTPQVGLVRVPPNTLNFVVIAHRATGDFTKEEAISYMEKAANKIDLGELAPQSADSVDFSLAVDTTPVSSGVGTGYRATICVPVSEDIFKKNLSIAMMAGMAAKRIADSLASTDSSNETKH